MNKNLIKVLSFIEHYIEVNGMSPTYSEINEYLGWKSRGSAHDLVKKLEQRGCIIVIPKQNRGIRVLREDDKIFTIYKKVQRCCLDIKHEAANKESALICVNNLLEDIRRYL